MELRTTPRSLLRPKEWPDGPDAKPIYVVVEAERMDRNKIFRWGSA
jgi:hypothetical protein